MGGPGIRRRQILPEFPVPYREVDADGGRDFRSFHIDHFAGQHGAFDVAGLNPFATERDRVGDARVFHQLLVGNAG